MPVPNFVCLCHILFYCCHTIISILSPATHTLGLCKRSECSGSIKCLWMDGCFEADSHALWLPGFGVAVPEWSVNTAMITQSYRCILDSRYACFHVHAHMYAQNRNLPCQQLTCVYHVKSDRISTATDKNQKVFAYLFYCYSRGKCSHASEWWTHFYNMHINIDKCAEWQRKREKETPKFSNPIQVLTKKWSTSRQPELQVVQVLSYTVKLSYHISILWKM